MSDDDPFGINYRTPPKEVGDPHTITQRLMRAMLTSEDKTLLIEKLDRDLHRHKALVEELLIKVRTLETGQRERFTREEAKALFAELFRADLSERAFLGKLVKLAFLPVGMLTLAATVDALIRMFFHHG